MNRLAIPLALCLLASPALADPTGAINAQVQIGDGDTTRIGSERIRLRSEAGPIDAPELRKSKCPLELFRAQAARERLSAIMRDAGDEG